MKKFLLLALSGSSVAFTINAADQQELINHVKKSIELACKESSKITQDILNLDGMSSPKVRHLLNNICSLPKASYLEIGVWKGSTFISALYKNTSLINAVAIDNWSEFSGPKDSFIANTTRFLPPRSFTFYEQDCFNVDLKKVFPVPINIYFYDGNHTAESQKSAFTYFDPILADTFIAMIDDWNYGPTKNGTKAAFQELNYRVIFEEELPARYNGDKENWWHGFYVAIIQKSCSR